MLARRAEEPLVMNGYQVPKGAFVLLPTYLIHHHPALWTNPEKFDPSRFSPERAATIPKGAYLPFSMGMRKCIGDGFALMEARLVLAVILQSVNVQPIAKTPPRPKVSVTLRPSGGLPSYVTRRHKGAVAAA